MNKIMAGVIAGLAMGACSAVSALDVSGGAGVVFGYDIVGQGVSRTWSYGGYDYERVLGYPLVNYGIQAFFDASFVEVALGLGFGSGKENSKYFVDGKESSWGQTTYSSSLSLTTLGISVLGKYNIPVRDGMEVFPALGVEYSLALGGEWEVGADDWFKDNARDVEAIDASQFKIDLGIGYDYILSSNVYLRALVLYGIGLPSKFSEFYETAADPGYDYDATFTHNLSLKLSLGYKF